MGWIELIGVVFKFALEVWSAINERNKEIKAKKEDILNEGLKAIVNRDASAITLFFERVKRL